jgi:hypothetical protein
MLLVIDAGFLMKSSAKIFYPSNSSATSRKTITRFNAIFSKAKRIVIRAL